MISISLPQQLGAVPCSNPFRRSSFYATTDSGKLGSSLIMVSKANLKIYGLVKKRLAVKKSFDKFYQSKGISI
jgi:hypothetical protein